MTTAHAAADETSPEERAAAQELFEQARALMADGKARDACPLFEESQRLDAGVGTQFNLATCYEALGKLASAYALFMEVAATARGRGQQLREQVARERAEAVKAMLSRLVIVVPPGQADRVVVERDGMALGQAQWGLAVPVDPGVHRIRASGPGLEEWAVEVEVPAGGAEQAVEVPLLDERVAPQVVDGSGARSRPVDAGRPFFEPTHRKIGLVAAGVGVLGIGVGSVFGLRAISKSDESDALGCVGDRCPTLAGVDARSQAETAGNVSTISMIGGIAGLATAAVLFLIDGDTGSRSLLVSPVTTAGGASLRMQGRF